MENGDFVSEEAIALGDEVAVAAGVGLLSALLEPVGWLLQPAKRKATKKKDGRRRVIINEGCREIALTVR